MDDPAPLIIGIGNDLRGDDGAGPRVAAALAGAGYRTLVHGGDGADLMDLWQGEAAVFLVDAATGAGPAGELRRLDAATTPLPTGFFRYSSHLFGLAEAVETARVLGRLPPRLVVYAIAGTDFAMGAAMTPAVAAACDAAVARLAAELGPPGGPSARA
ncbi:MAG: hydrogenase maturation protease [Hyphomicrobiales bacterium]|nr:hydrogenase maturation protease [Hyphomicrobiales bacterium]